MASTKQPISIPYSTDFSMNPSVLAFSTKVRMSIGFEY